jgi:hypothetical protein
MDAEHKLHIHFTEESHHSAADWSRAGWAALEQAKAELVREGTDVSLAPDGTTNEGARGFSVDDVLVSLAVSVAANAITSLLSHAVNELRQRLRRSSRGQTYSQTQDEPVRAITLRAGAKSLVVPTYISDEETHQRIANWMGADTIPEDITISPTASAPSSGRADAQSELGSI